MKVKSCRKCHHYPSGRVIGDGTECTCHCHDIADLGPALLAAAKAVLKADAAYMADESEMYPEGVLDAIRLHLTPLVRQGTLT